MAIVLSGVHRQPSLSPEQLAQRLPLHERHHEVRDGRAGAILDHAGIEDRKDVGVLEPCGELDLAKEPLHPLPSTELGPDDLERHRAFVPEIARQIDGGHATRTDLALHCIPAADGGRQAFGDVAHG